MTSKLRTILATALVLLTALAAQAQELEYALELGAMGGGSFYMGDANTDTPYKGLNGAASVFGRYNLNPRMALKFNIAYAGISGNASNIDNKFPHNPDVKLKFRESLVDIGCQYELHFWGYGLGTGFKGARRLAPYIQLGLGATAGNGVVTANIPIGFGVKYKLRPRWNVGLDWSMRFSMSDQLDGIDDPLRIQSGMLKNKDSYCMTMLSISYDLCPKYRKCNNE